MPSAEDCATLQAYIEGVDHAVREAEAEWGMDRLPALVDDDLRAKFYRQVAKWRDAIETAWASKMLTRDQLADVAARGAAMQRAWSALAAAASEAGHRPILPDVWEATLADGTVAAIVRTNAEASKVNAAGRHLVVYTLAEVANVIDALPGAIALAKVEFPGAKVQPPRDRSWLKNGDAIPFGEVA